MSIAKIAMIVCVIVLAVCFLGIIVVSFAKREYGSQD